MPGPGTRHEAASSSHPVAHVGNEVYVHVVEDPQSEAPRWLRLSGRPASVDSKASEDRAPAYVAGPADEASGAPRADEVGEEFLVLPRSVLEHAQQATQPFRLRADAQERAAGTEDPAAGTGTFLLSAAARLLEGARLLGPDPEVRPHPIAKLVGPMLTTPQVVRATGTSRQNLAAQAKKRRLVRLASTQRTQWWPTFQFRRARGRIVPHPGVQALWAALPAGTVSDWDHAAWVCAPRHDLDGDAPIDLATDEEAIGCHPLREALEAYTDRLLR